MAGTAIRRLYDHEGALYVSVDDIVDALRASRDSYTAHGKTESAHALDYFTTQIVSQMLELTLTGDHEDGNSPTGTEDPRGTRGVRGSHPGAAGFFAREGERVRRIRERYLA